MPAFGKASLRKHARLSGLVAHVAAAEEEEEMARVLPSVLLLFPEDSHGFDAAVTRFCRRGFPSQDACRDGAVGHLIPSRISSRS
jgi:hypothetical protein